MTVMESSRLDRGFQKAEKRESSLFFSVFVHVPWDVAAFLIRFFCVLWILSYSLRVFFFAFYTFIPMNRLI